MTGQIPRSGKTSRGPRGSTLRAKGCVSPCAAIKRSNIIRNSPIYHLPRIRILIAFLIRSITHRSCPPFPPRPTAMPPPHCGIRPRATSNHRARAPTLLTYPTQGVMSPYIVSRTFRATRRPFLRVKKNNEQRFKRTLPQKCVCVTHDESQGGLNILFFFSFSRSHHRGSSHGNSSGMKCNGFILTSVSMTHTFAMSPSRSSLITSLPSSAQKSSHIRSTTLQSWS